MTDQPERHTEAIEAVAVEVARRRTFDTGYTAADAATDNAAGWAIVGYPTPIVLTDVELTDVWKRSGRVLRAWA